jgi:hypothetical protein
MPRRSIPVGSVNQINVESEPAGLCAVYLVETQSPEEAMDLSGLFEQFGPMLDTLPLSTGKLTTYAVKLVRQDQRILEEIEGLLKKSFGFVILHRSFDQPIYDIVGELCKDSGSRLLPIPACDICGRPEPFPRTKISFLDEDREVLASRIYCSTCTTEYMGHSSKEFVISLLEADKGDFGPFTNVHLVRNRSSKKHLAFRIKADAEHQFAM